MMQEAKAGNIVKVKEESARSVRGLHARRQELHREPAWQRISLWDDLLKAG